MATDFDVIVMGSGSGGAVVACRLAEAGLRVPIEDACRSDRNGRIYRRIAVLVRRARLLGTLCQLPSAKAFRLGSRASTESGHPCCRRVKAAEQLVVLV